MNQQVKLPHVIRPPIAIGIIVVCIAVFLANNISAHLALWPMYSGYFQPWQLVSYGFLHGSFNHLFFNMFALWMFGLPIEKLWGSKRFAEYYFFSILGAGLIQLLVQYISGEVYPTIGASGAVHAQGRVRDDPQRLFQGVLYGGHPFPGLRLPAAVAGAVVGDTAGKAGSAGQRLGGKKPASQSGPAGPVLRL